MAFFEGNKMTGGYGDGPDIISSCTINVNRGEIVAILGPNGAGKSTAMKAMLGLLNLKSGKISIDGEDISKLSPQERVKKGISFVPQTRNVFAELTVKENLEVGAFLRTDNVNNVIEEIYDLFPILREKKDQVVGQLSGGQRQQVALGRALMIKPSVLMLDEPTAALSPLYQQQIIERIDALREVGITVLIVEQNARLSLARSDRGYILSNGKVVHTGNAEDILNDPHINEYFLGTKGD